MGRWPQGVTVFWYLDESDLSPADVPQLEAPIAAGIESWPLVCGVAVQRTYNPGRANVIVRFIADLSSDPSVPASANQSLWLQGVELGLTDEPVADPPVQLTMRLNPNPAALPGGAYSAQSLQDVACHEFGHALGFDHPADGIISCMSADINLRVSTQTPYDIQVAQAIYGPPLSPPAAVPPAAAPVPSPSSGATMQGAFVAMLISTVEPAVAQYLAAELKKGTDLQTAVDNTTAKLADLIPIPALHPAAEKYLQNVVHAFEEIGVKALGGTPDPSLNPAS